MNWMKVYFVWKIGIFQCHVSFQGCASQKSWKAILKLPQVSHNPQANSRKSGGLRSPEMFWARHEGLNTTCFFSFSDRLHKRQKKAAAMQPNRESCDNLRSASCFACFLVFFWFAWCRLEVVSKVVWLCGGDHNYRSFLAQLRWSPYSLSSFEFSGILHVYNPLKV